jgi:hypothetical protein
MTTDTFLTTQGAETASIEPHEALACAVLRQTVNDALLFRRYIRNPYKNKYRDAVVRNQIGDAQRFIMTNQLEKYITFMNLGLDADYIRKTYLKLTRSVKYNKRGMVTND